MAVQEAYFVAPSRRLPERLSTCGIESLRPEDLLFCSRPGWLTWLNASAGDPWRHLGVVARIDGQLVIVEIDRDRIGSRPIEGRIDGYDTIGVARLSLSDSDRALLAAAVAALVAKPQRYPWLAVAATGSLALGRRWVPVVIRKVVTLAVWFGCRESGGVTFSAIVAMAMDNVPNVGCDSPRRGGAEGCSASAPDAKRRVVSRVGGRAEPARWSCSATSKRRAGPETSLAVGPMSGTIADSLQWSRYRTGLGHDGPWPTSPNEGDRPPQ